MAYAELFRKVHEFSLGRYTLRWEYHGEGVSGDYEPERPGDIPLLRVDIEGRSMEENPLASYCTLAPVWTPRDELYKMSENLVKNLPEDPNNFTRRPMELWTWTTKYEWAYDEIAAGAHSCLQDCQ